MRPRLIKFLLSLFLFAFPSLVVSSAPEAVFLSAHAEQLNEQLREQILPYWLHTTHDSEHGGYLLADTPGEDRTATEKQLVSQSRMIWGFSHAHIHGFDDDNNTYLEAAEQGYRFLQEHFFDREHGGYFWATDLEGNVVNDRKILYGEAFVLYALVELHRANGDPAPLRHAMELYESLQHNARDTEHGGWFEHFERDWTPILKPTPGVHVEVAGLKSANAHLHLMEALTELYDATRNDEVEASLREALHINATYFYPLDAAESAFHRHPDWSPVTAESSAGLSYGHNVEFAWLMIRAEQFLNDSPSWEHFYAHIDHALENGTDHERGGLYDRGYGNEPATGKNKIWWVQAEWLAALTEAIDHRPDPGYETALKKLLHFIHTFQADPADGIWYETVSDEGMLLSKAKAHNWKTSYHDVRAIIKFIEAFHTPAKSS